ncbi:MAG: cytochrome c maturation protein CcmE [Chloroflexi bacterium]|nr:cytochrome c maturation protein CcmE [Chloroflexota bacterium]
MQTKELDLRMLDELDPAPSGPQRQRKRGGLTPTRIRLMSAGLLLLFALGYLVVSATGASAVYYLTVTELRALSPEALTRPARVAGVVEPGSIRREGQALRFTLVEADAETPFDQVAKDAPRLNVIFRGVIPDVFQDEVHAVVEGKLGGDGVFDARNLLAKCPSRFEAMPEKKNAPKPWLDEQPQGGRS